jgi:hypothetical protein
VTHFALMITMNRPKDCVSASRMCNHCWWDLALSSINNYPSRVSACIYLRMHKRQVHEKEEEEGKSVVKMHKGCCDSWCVGKIQRKAIQHRENFPSTEFPLFLEKKERKNFLSTAATF